ncbi:hypothetical protein QUB75_27115 [Microcoleus sp. K1-B6]|uniref:hypothetical protein n=1 Tax=unclassified Microcoleus TaxID=2642155 RepID=UPI002FD0FD63
MQEALEVEIVGESNRVECESNRVECESNRDSMRDEWIGATTAIKLTDLTKSAFQRAISHLLGVRGCQVDLIRRGGSKNTRYSRFAVEMVKAHKSGDEVLLQQLLEFAAKPASSTQSSGLAVVDHVAALEGKIANLRQTGAANSQLNADRIQSKLAEIAANNQTAQRRSEALGDAELLAAENRGIERGLAVFNAEEAALENTVAHLRALKISANQ